MATVNILLATYNGEKYIEQQLLSLIGQSYRDWQLLVHDDGSTDATLELVKKWQHIDKRIQIVEDGKSFRSAAGNFMHLLQYSTSPFVAFCDQDDIWFEKKLEILVNFASNNFDELVPCLVYADGYAYSDSEGVIISQSISHLHAFKLNEFLFFNSGYQGCSMLFNSCLVNMAKNYRAAFYMHDDLVSLLAHVFGKVYFIPKQLMLYRQHQNNVTGNTDKSKASIALRFFRRGAFVISRKHYDEKNEFYKEFKAKMSDRDRLLFAQYLKFPEVSLLRRLCIILRNEFSMGGYRLPLLVKTLIRRPIE